MFRHRRNAYMMPTSTSLFRGIFVLQLLSVSLGFVVMRRKCSHVLHRDIYHVHHPSPAAHVVMFSEASSSTESTGLRPVFVDCQTAAFSATTALYVSLILKQKLKIPSNTDGSPEENVPVYPVTNLDTMKHSEEAILHLSLGLTSDQVPEQIINEISYLGIYLASEPLNGDNVQVPAATAESSGHFLQQQLNTLSTHTGRVWISLDVALHVAMLRANCLPKLPNPQDAPHQNSYYVMQQNGDAILVNYFFDPNKLSGMDPLSSDSSEILVETSPTEHTLLRSAAQSSAYTALRGNGMDALPAAAIAASVATVLGDTQFAATTPKPLWSDLQRAVQLAQHIREYGTRQDSPGMMRRKYTEFGYR